MIIDIHTHLPEGGADILPALRDECRRNGVSRVLVSSLGPGWAEYPSARQVRAANEEACALAARSGGLAKWHVYLNPQNANWREEFRRAMEGGPIGVKLLIALKDPRGQLGNTVAVIRHAGARKLPVLIHTFNKPRNFPGEIILEEFAALAEACPGATLIAAHAGGHWRHSLGVLRRRAPNACVDISGSFPQKGMVEALVEDVGAGRILFGSDFPIRTMASQIAKVLFADIPERAKERILGRNALAVFGPAIAPGAPLPGLPLRALARLPDARTDHFCFCGRWPFFATPAATPAELERLLAAHDIDKAYTGDLGGVYRLDLEQANAEFLRAAKRARRVAPLATLNPRAHNWRRVIQYLAPGATGAIVYPYLHDWALDDPAHAEFFRQCAERRIPLWINCRLSDDRFRHTGLAARLVTPEELVRFARRAPRNRCVFQGLTAAEIVHLLADAPPRAPLRFEISRLTDHPGGLDATATRGRSRLVMGSEFPFRDLREVRWTARRL